MTCTLRYIDVRFLLPKRRAFAEAVDTGEVAVAGHVVAKDTIDGIVVPADADDVGKTASVTVNSDFTKDAR